MNRTITLLLFILTFAVMVSAGFSRLLMAQNMPGISPETKTDTNASVPGTEETSSSPSEDKPVTKKKSFMVKLSHKEYADMDLKMCAECHMGSGVAPTHGTEQMREHVSIARREGGNCVDCHKQQFCLDCHTGGGIDANLNVSNYRGNYVPNTHRTSFREIHPLKALDNPQTCIRCHDSKFCSECHTKFRGEDLRTLSHRRSLSDLPAGTGTSHSTFTTNQCRTCHPGGLLPEQVWSADHATEARRNLQSCQACHSDGDTCLTCHSNKQGLKVSPHPRNWDAVKDKYRSKSGGRSCSKCHDNY